MSKKTKTQRRDEDARWEFARAVAHGLDPTALLERVRAGEAVTVDLIELGALSGPLKRGLSLYAADHGVNVHVVTVYDERRWHAPTTAALRVTRA